MATTIKLKNGSGAPTAGDLVQGEPAIDLTNKRLYTEDSGGSVIEVGSNPSSLSIAGTAVTATATELNILDGVTSTTAELNILDGVTSTAAELNILDGVTASTAELNLLDGVTATTAELNILDGVTATATELNILDGVTSTTAELNILDGVTATATELNILDGVTATTAELNFVDGVTSNIQTQLDAKGSGSVSSLSDLSITATASEINVLDGVTATTAELNILDGVTSTATELNILDGVTATTAELNILDGVTATAAELNILDGVTSTTAELNILDGVTATASELNVLDGVTAFLDEDDFSSNSATAIPSQQSVKAYVTSSVSGAGGMSNVVEDTTPQLGGSLDVNGQDIVSVSNGNITLTPNGTGVVRLDSDVDIQSGEIVLKNSGTVSNIKLYCESSNLHYTQLQSAAHADYSGNVTLTLPPSTDTLVGKATTDTLTNKTLTSAVLNTGVSGTAVLDEDDMSSDSATQLATQQSIKAYVDSKTGTNITTVGTIGTGTWQGSVIADAYVANDLTISGGTIENTVIGASTAAAGTFTTFTSNGIDDNASSTAITIASGGDVTIDGTDASTSISSTAILNLKAGDADNEYSTLRFATSADGSIGYVGAKATTTGAYPNSVGNLEFGVQNGSSTVTAMTIDNTGNIGIGTSTATYDLTVVGDSNLSTIGTNDAALRIRADGARTMQFYTNSTERMRVTSGGAVGIGVTAPTRPLQVSRSADTWISVRTTTTTNTTGILFGDSGSDSVGQIGYVHSDNSMRFITNSAEDMRLTSGGNLHVDANVIAYSTTISDERLKDDVQGITGALDTVDALRGVTYIWNAGSREGQRDYGVIAQEVEQVIPEIVHDTTMPLLGDEETVYKTVDYEKLCAVLISAVSELRAEVEDLKNAASR